MAADPDKYGFILVNACAIPELPLTQIVATMADGADSETVQAEIERPARRAGGGSHRAQEHGARQ